MSSFLEELAWRGLLYQKTAEEALDEHLQRARTGYCGFDPTAGSLTIGNLVPIMLLIHWQRFGNRPIVVMGGATGMIGDPSGKDAERPLLTRDQIEANIVAQRRIFERLLDFDPDSPSGARLLNNAEWLDPVGLVAFLRDVGKHFSVNAMVQKESVRNRLHTRDQGISYTEFSYMLLQAFDYLHLRRTMGCTVQMAGSDQYGNVTAGIDLIHRVMGRHVAAFGITAPLVTRADGRKIGKSEGGTVWLSADRTSPYAFYQYWINVADSDVSSFLRRFTLLGREEIEELERLTASSPERRSAQRALARHMTERLHGVEERVRVEAASEALFGGGELETVDPTSLEEMAAELPQSAHDPELLAGEGCSLVDLLPATTLASSKREARELVENGAIRVNGKGAKPGYVLRRADLLPCGLVFLRRGKKQWHVTRWSPAPRG